MKKEFENRYWGSGVEWADALEDDILKNLETISSVEIIPENFFGGRHASFLEAIREAGKPVAVHGVELSIGSADGFKQKHFEKMLEVADQVNMVNFSEHLSMTEASGIELGALTPLFWSMETADAICRNIDRIQSRLDVPFLIENVSNRFIIPGGDFTETEFINTILRKTGCQLLLDLNNVHSNAINFKFDPYQWIDHIDLANVGMVHLAGGYYDPEGFLMDSHDQETPEPVWDLYRYLCQRKIPAMTIVERTDNYPAFSEILTELAKAEAICEASMKRNRGTELKGAPIWGA